MKLSLRPATNLDIKTVSATMALAKRGLSLLKAKRAVEEMVANGLVLVELPMVEDRAAVESDLAAAGICATQRSGHDLDGFAPCHGPRHPPRMANLITIDTADVATLRRCADLIRRCSWGEDYPVDPFEEISKADYHVAAQHDGLLIGYACINRHASPDGQGNGQLWFACAVVDPGYRRQGVLSDLYDACMRYAAGRGPVLACTDNPVMAGFFADHGWMLARETVDEAGGCCKVFCLPSLDHDLLADSAPQPA
jgi:GNAT superfamily N-acetyltransferase